jgi:hypothetical protein
LWLDFRFGGYVGGCQNSRFAHLGACAVDNLTYRILKEAVDAIAVSPDDVLVDVGCGRGRVLNWWLSLGWQNRMVGVELDPAVATATRRRLRRFRNVEIVTGDAVNLTPSDATICFLYNPFGRAVVQRWHDTVLNSKAPHLTVVYINCQHLDVFHESGRWSIRTVPKDPREYCQIAVAELDVDSDGQSRRCIRRPTTNADGLRSNSLAPT